MSFIKIQEPNFLLRNRNTYSKYEVVRKIQLNLSKKREKDKQKQFILR